MAHQRPARPIRILHLTPWQEPCGIAGYAESLVRALELHGVENSVITNNATRWRYSVGPDSQKFFDDVVKAAQDHDLVHVQHEWSFFTASSMCASIRNYGRLLDRFRKHRIASCTTFHTEPSFTRSAKRGSTDRSSIARWFLKRFSLQSYAWRRRIMPHFNQKAVPCQAIVHTPNTRAMFARSGLSTDSIRELPMGFEELPQVATGDRQAAKKALGLPSDCRLVSIFGFVSHYKGHDVALDALKLLPAHYHLAVVGGSHPQAQDHFFDSVVARAKRFAGRVHVTGYADRATADTYMTASGACLAPYHQWSGLASSAAITRAIASGRPVIASKIEAFAHLQREAECLFMVTPDQKAELAWAIDRVCNDKTLQRRLGQRGLAFAAEYSWANVAEQTLNLYETMLASRAGLTTDTSSEVDEPPYAFKSSAPEAQTEVVKLRRVAA